MDPVTGAILVAIGTGLGSFGMYLFRRWYERSYVLEQHERVDRILTIISKATALGFKADQAFQMLGVEPPNLAIEHGKRPPVSLPPGEGKSTTKPGEASGDAKGNRQIPFSLWEKFVFRSALSGVLGVIFSSLAVMLYQIAGEKAVAEVLVKLLYVAWNDLRTSARLSIIFKRETQRPYLQSLLGMLSEINSIAPLLPEDELKELLEFDVTPETRDELLDRVMAEDMKAHEYRADLSMQVTPEDMEGHGSKA